MAVELQLGLALPISIKTSLFDLNTSSSYSDESDASSKKTKRSFEDSSESDCASTITLPLLQWNKQPKDDDNSSNFNRTCNLNLIQSEEEEIVGWPPIKTYWKKQRGQDIPIVRANGLYVKARIEGEFITRKIDLSLHQSYETLTSTLLFMFGKGHESVEEYTLNYQDKEGDWLLATPNTPWRAFLGSVRRIKLMRKED